MLIFMAPSKTMQITSLKTLSPLQCLVNINQLTPPLLISKSDVIVQELKSKSLLDISTLFATSATLTKQTFELYEKFLSSDIYYSTSSTSMPNLHSETEQFSYAGLAYDGPAFKGLNVEQSLTTSKLISIAEKHLRIISALYGLVRITDKIQEYRLEMNTKIKINKTDKNICDYWKPFITDSINKELDIESNRTKYVINLASEEYFHAINVKSLNQNIQIIKCEFLDNGKIVSTYAKRARGLMANYIITYDEINTGNPLYERSQTSTEELWDISSNCNIIDVLKSFNSEGYIFHSETIDSKVATANFPMIILTFNRHINNKINIIAKNDIDASDRISSKRKNIQKNEGEETTDDKSKKRKNNSIKKK
eukprot:gene4846-6793_t